MSPYRKRRELPPTGSPRPRDGCGCHLPSPAPPLCWAKAPGLEIESPLSFVTPWTSPRGRGCRSAQNQERVFKQFLFIGHAQKPGELPTPNQKPGFRLLLAFCRPVTPPVGKDHFLSFLLILRFVPFPGLTVSYRIFRVPSNSRSRRLSCSWS